MSADGGPGRHRPRASSNETTSSSGRKSCSSNTRPFDVVQSVRVHSAFEVTRLAHAVVWEVNVSDEIEAIVDRVVDTYPQHIALAVKELEDHLDERAGFSFALRAFEESTRYLSLMGLALYLHN